MIHPRGKGGKPRGLDEIAKWQPDRIAAFFEGIAKVMTAKGKLEGEEK